MNYSSKKQYVGMTSSTAAQKMEPSFMSESYIGG